MIPAGAHPRVRGAWFWTGMVYGLFVLPLMGPALLPVLAVFFFIEGQGGWAWTMVVAAVALLAIYVAWLAWYVGALQRSFVFELSADTLTIRRGVVFRRTSRIPLRRVQDVVAKDGPFLRAAGVGTVHVQTAGLHAAGGFAGAAEGVMPGLEDPQAVAQEVLERVKALRGDV